MQDGILAGDVGSMAVPAGVPATWVERLRGLLKPVDELKGVGRSGLGDDILRYVLHGEPLTVLAEVAQKPTFAKHLHLSNHYGSEVPASPKLYHDFDAVPPAMMLRWAKVIDACVPNRNQCFHLRFERGVTWPEALLTHTTGAAMDGWISPRPKAKDLSATGMEALFVEDGLNPASLWLAGFAAGAAAHYGAVARTFLLTDLTGYAQGIARHAEAIRPHVLAKDVDHRLHALEMLAPVDDAVLATFAPDFAEMLVSTSKQVRAAVEPFARRCGSAMEAPLREAAAGGRPEQRLLALRALWTYAQQAQNQGLITYVRDTATADKAPSVQALVEEWDDRAARDGADAASFEITLPVITWVDEVTPAVSVLLDRLWQDINASIAKANTNTREWQERMKAQGKPVHAHHLIDPLDAADLLMLKAYLSSTDPACREKIGSAAKIGWQHAGPVLRELGADPAVTPALLLKLLAFFDVLHRGENYLSGPAEQALATLHRARGAPGLLALSLMLEAMGLKGARMVLLSYCSRWGGALGRDWEAEAVWPFFAHHLDVLTQMLQSSAGSEYSFDRGGLYRAAATLPSMPAAVVDALFELALGSSKNERLPAQQALERYPERESRVNAALSSGKADVRALAAQWLGRLRSKAALPALEQAVAKEKHDLAKGAMLDALQALGQPVEKYLDRDALAADARKGLARPQGKDLDWFPWAALPAVRWEDSGADVPPDVLRWLLVQAVKQKSPEPNAVLRKYSGMFMPRDREALAQFVLESWLAEDTRPFPVDVATANARRYAQSTHRQMTQTPQYYQGSPNLGLSEAELLARVLPGFLRQPGGSAIASKGLLAVVAACAGAQAAAPVGRYLKEFYGTRAAQGKALIAMLAWIEHPTATQLMLSIGSRFRTKGFQEEATKQAEALAERKGWTLAELADRTMPSAGFDENAELELNFGPRVFTARLGADYKIELFNAEGKKIAVLPEPRQDDDAELAKDAKKAFSAAKKQVKAIVDMQSDRLYEALCTEREWSFEDWNRYLNGHPIVRRLLQRVVWSVVEDDRTVATFRPLDDGTLSDNDDNAVTVDAAARVRVAHDSNLAAEQVEAWQRHLVDYKITPLFQQFGKGTYVLPADQARASKIEAFEGYLLEAFALRGRANKLGYTRGPAEDGGWFHVYEKRFTTLGLVAVIEFTGNPLPEENRTVALLNLHFTSAQGESWERGEIALSQVPKVLLSECYNDLRLIAAEGSGFDAEWGRKTSY